MFSLFSDVKSSFLAGESLTLRFSRLEAAYKLSISLGHWEQRDGGKRTCFDGVTWVAIVDGRMMMSRFMRTKRSVKRCVEVRVEVWEEWWR